MSRHIPILILLILAAGPAARTQWSQLPGKGSHWCLALYLTDNAIVAATQDSNILRSTDQGLTWVQSSQGIQDSLYTNVLFGDGNAVYLGSNKGGYRSTDVGQSWHRIDAGPSGPQAVYAFYRLGGYLFMGGDSGVFRSADGGTSWLRINDGLSSGASVLSFGSNEKYLFAGTRVQALYRSSDNGEHWELFGSGMNKHASISSLWVHDSTIVGFIEGQGLYRSTNDGETWQVNYTPFGLSASAVYYVKEVNGTLFAGCDNGLLRSTNNGASWEEVSTGMEPGTLVLSIAVDNGIVYAGAYKQWLWKRSLSEILPPSDVSASFAPYALRLNQSTPNPATSATEISYALPSYASVNLKLYNAMMQEISTLIDEPQEAGEHHATLDASALPSGVYYYRLSTGTSSLIRRMLIVK